MQKLADLSIRRPVFASMIVLALMVVGAASWFGLSVDRFPAVDLPNMVVRTILPGGTLASAGGALFLRATWVLARNPGKDTARASFRASLVQLSFLLVAAIADRLA